MVRVRHYNSPCTAPINIQSSMIWNSGFPWKSRDLWVKLSNPFFEADKIKTPTLFLGGEKDFNVPVAGSEQMYQALRANGVDTSLVIYPGEFHGIRKPTYVQDRLERYIAWYAQYLKKTGL